MRAFAIAAIAALCLGIGWDSAAQTGRGDRSDLADVPPEFRFLFLAPEESARTGDAADHWARLPYDSISLERGFTGGCLIQCSTYKVSFHRGPIPGDAAPFNTRGRAELRAVAPEKMFQRPIDRSGAFTGAIDLATFAHVSYLLHKLRFSDLPDKYDSPLAQQDHPFTTLSVTAGGKTKAVVDYGDRRPIELWAIQEAIDSAARRVAWALE